uniref:Uncharacterized protein n=1 Tax=Timema bartmani TaxID=61472 RepID=A0A7R9FBQ4_9NEOP|nr:unnamed protein product [Timema bartmani]
MEEHGLEVFEWIEPQAGPLPGPSAVRSGTQPLLQSNNLENSLLISLSKYRANTPEHVKKKDTHTDVEELDSDVKLFQGIQEWKNSTNKELATGIGKFASAQEGL